MAGGVVICIEIDNHRINRRLETNYLDKATDSFEEALKMAKDAVFKKIPLSIGLLGNAADIVPKFVSSDIIPDMVTDQTSAHDELIGYIPNHHTIEEADNYENPIQKSISMNRFDLWGNM
ncbi:hypothetical protein Ct9H90mP29_13500 [bacterium]|nr:MAG: hypothetical protein Ct9H90mP29_13500 [bacterium]